ncbi:MAG: LamG-like jellyroll fold domain-containing protein, partial [Bacteroidota bacterium]|nr:LamG-like jellyroll fold domain-containing protein [Bacteroidota bacterium]
MSSGVPSRYDCAGDYYYLRIYHTALNTTQINSVYNGRTIIDYNNWTSSTNLANIPHFKTANLSYDGNQALLVPYGITQTNAQNLYYWTASGDFHRFEENHLSNFDAENWKFGKLSGDGNFFVGFTHSSTALSDTNYNSDTWWTDPVSNTMIIYKTMQKISKRTVADATATTEAGGTTYDLNNAFSSDSGVTSYHITHVNVSETGQYILIVGGNSSSTYTNRCAFSSDFGVTFSDISSKFSFTDVTKALVYCHVSDNGRYLFISQYNSNEYCFSSDYGNTFTLRNTFPSSTKTYGVVSRDGQIALFVDTYIYVYTSVNGNFRQEVIPALSGVNSGLSLTHNNWKYSSTLSEANLIYNPSMPNIKYFLGTLNTALIAAQSPIYHFDFRQSSSTSITDSIGGLTATYVNSPTSTISDGISLAGGTTDGAGQYVNLQDFEIGGASSFEVYVKFGSSVDNFERIFDFGNGHSVENIIMGRSGTTSTLQFVNLTDYSSGAIPAVDGVGTIVSGELTHLVGVTQSDGYLKFYQDGTLLGTSTTACGTTSKTRTNHYVGRSNYSSRSDTDCNIYYLRVYNTALTQSDVTSLYTNRDNRNVTELTSSSVPYISDTGKNMAFTNFTTNGSYITAFSNNYGTSFVDMKTRLGGTTTGSHGLLNLHVTDNQKYIYGINPSRGIVKSTNYGHEFTDVSMVSLPDSDLSFNITNRNTNAQIFDLSHADTICSSSDGRHTYIVGPQTEIVAQPTEIPVPSYDYDFKNNQSIVDNISSHGGTLQGDASIGADGLTLDGTGDRFDMDPSNFTWGGTNTLEFYVKLTTQTQSGVNLGIMGFGLDNQNSGGAYLIVQTGTAQTHYAFYQRDDTNTTHGDVTTTSINYNSFDHHVMVFDPTSGIKYYINGTLALDTNAAYTSTAQTRSNYEYRVGAPPYNDATNGIA